MNLNQATIKIKNLRLRTYIGINDDEIKNKQDVVVNVTIHYDAGRATDSDSVDDALNYKTVTKSIIALVEDNRFSLLEKLTAEVLNIAAEGNLCGSRSGQTARTSVLRLSFLNPLLP